MVNAQSPVRNFSVSPPALPSLLPSTLCMIVRSANPGWRQKKRRTSRFPPSRTPPKGRWKPREIGEGITRKNVRLRRRRRSRSTEEVRLGDGKRFFTIVSLFSLFVCVYLYRAVKGASPYPSPRLPLFLHISYTNFQMEGGRESDVRTMTIIVVPLFNSLCVCICIVR